MSAFIMLSVEDLTLPVAVDIDGKRYEAGEPMYTREKMALLDTLDAEQLATYIEHYAADMGKRVGAMIRAAVAS